jgi:hypothetical protein
MSNSHLGRFENPPTHRVKKPLKMRRRTPIVIRNRHKRDNLKHRCEMHEIPRKCVAACPSLLSRGKAIV